MSWQKYATKAELRKVATLETRIYKLRRQIQAAQNTKGLIYHKAKYRRRKANDGS